MLVGFTVSCGCAATPAPVTAIANGEFDALLTREMLPFRVVPESGENLAVKVVLCPAMSVDGVASPVMLSPEPDMLICEIVMVEEPELVSVTGEEPVDPTSTLPNETLAGLASSVEAPATPIPESVRV